MAQISLNYDAVASAVNQINVLVGDIKSRTDTFMGLVTEANDNTQNRWTLIVNLQNTIQAEVENIKQIQETQDDLKRALDRYADMVAEADDGSEFNLD